MSLFGNIDFGWPLMEADALLNPPPSSADELLPVLDRVQICLTTLPQSPLKWMQQALFPVQKALVSSELLRHSDVDVKVAVASCISEITRITAPEPPYDDEQMKEIFQLIVYSFEELSDMSSRSYNKRTLILEIVAKVRSCVVMLDLEFDVLIIEMFQHFLKSIRDNHSENVFVSMEKIMIIVLEESDDISVELLTPMLASQKKDNKEFLPIAQKLVKNVFQKCANKLKPYLIQAVKSLGIFPEDYNEVVSSICLEKCDSVKLHDENKSCNNRAVDANTEQTSMKRGKKPNCKLNSAKHSVSSPVDSDKEAEDLHAQMKIHKEGHSSPREDSSLEAASPLGQEKVTGVQPFLRKAGGSETLSPSGTLPDQNSPRKVGRSKKRESSIQEAKTPPGVTKRASEGTSDSGVRRQKRSGKNQLVSAKLQLLDKKLIR